MTTQRITVEGMTCEHCVNAVTAELVAIQGVSEVLVNLETGSVTFEAEHKVDQSQLQAAIIEAGYELVSS